MYCLMMIKVIIFGLIFKIMLSKISKNKSKILKLSNDFSLSTVSLQNSQSLLNNNSFNSTEFLIHPIHK